MLAYRAGMSTSHGPDESRSREAAAAKEERAGRAGLSFVGEWLLVALLTFIGSLLLVTFPAALAAGVAHLRRHVTGRDTRLALYWRDLGRSLRVLWPAGLVLPALVVVVNLNLLMARSGSLPGAGAVVVATLVLALGVAVVVVRSAAAWSRTTGLRREPSPRFAELSRLAWDRTVADWSGSLLVALAVVGCIGLVYAYRPLVVLVGAVLAVVLLGVEARRARRGI
ncbi:hypothetical protein SAMN04489860_2607 [Paraoerskovia marina]|uniref:Uncharacterized protein n=2 Tax=Paraoerskovia marina TaxID=545619 RepID=A0A1H1VT07_9CELL|nr:hypothetical protein SAMN04489860_2607 [Paraoerskovia marina]